MDLKPLEPSETNRKTRHLMVVVLLDFSLNQRQCNRHYQVSK